MDIRSFFGSRESSDEATVPDVVRISAGALASARRTLVLTGAGLSVAAGLPTYRGAGGLYTGPGGVPPFLHADALPDNVQQLWEFWAPFRESVAVAEPTVGHRALAAWQQAREASGAEVTLVTANVDDLHERAGSSRVHHLHGSVFATTCLAPGCGIRLDEDDRSLPEVATCTVCGGATRPGMVLFGEVVELDAQWAARQMLRQCEAFMCVGTSGTVSPPYSWLRYARDLGAPSILVNPDPDAGEGFDHHVPLEADVALPMLLQQ